MNIRKYGEDDMWADVEALSLHDFIKATEKVFKDGYVSYQPMQKGGLQVEMYEDVTAMATLYSQVFVRKEFI